jgi:2'-5' RNA ligase
VTGDGRIRLFCGLQLPDGVGRDLAVWAEREVRHGRLVRAEDLHVTLAFLGSRPPDDVPRIAAELREASRDAGRVELRPLRYRETRSVGMIVLDDADGAATALADDLQERLERLGVYRRERRPFLPHITVTRFRERAGARADPANMCSIHVVRSALYRSILGSGGARYDVLETAALGGR